MKKLNDYIKVFTEENLGIKYENLIANAFNFLVIYNKNKNIKENDIFNSSLEIEELKIKLKELKSLKNDSIEDFNNLLKKINYLFPFKSFIVKNDGKQVKLKISLAKKNTAKIINSRIEKLEKILEEEDKLKSVFNKPEYLEFLKIKNGENVFNDSFIIALKIAEDFEKKYGLVHKCYHIGDRHFIISDYWRDLFKIKDKKYDSYVKNKFFLKKNIKNSKTSLGKTDIIINDNFRLSLKLEDNQLGSPSYVDIYTLILNAINITIKTITNNNQLDIDDIQDKLEKELQIDSSHTNEYATIINISIIVDILCNKFLIKDTSDLELFLRKNITDYDIQESIKDFKNLFITNSDIEKIINSENIEENLEKLMSEKQKMSNFFIDQIKQRDISLQKNKYPLFIDDVPNSKEVFKTLIAKLINLSGGDNYFGFKKDIDKNFQKLRLFFNTHSNVENKKINNQILPKRVDFYENIFKLRNIAKNANLKIKNLLDGKEDFLKKIFKENNEKFINYLNKNKNKIKKEIIKEAIIGEYKFQDIEPKANYILAFNKKGDSKYIEINDNYINSVINEININFSFKAGDNFSYHAMRLESESPLFQINNSFLDKKINNKIHYNESIFNNIINYFNDFKLKIIKMIYFTKNKALKLLNILGIEIKIKKTKMPKWLVDKL